MRTASTVTAYSRARSVLRDVKSRRPRVAACPIAPKIAPQIAPTMSPVATTANQLYVLNSPNSNPMNSPNHAPPAAPAHGRPAGHQPAEHVLHQAQVRTDGRGALNREILVRHLRAWRPEHGAEKIGAWVAPVCR